MEVVYGSMSWSFNIATVRSALVWPPGGTSSVRSSPRPRKLATSPASFLYSASINRWYCAAVGYCSGRTMIWISRQSAVELVEKMCSGEVCLETLSGFTITCYGVISPWWAATWSITSHPDRSLLVSICISISPVRPWRMSTNIAGRIVNRLQNW